MRYSVGWMTMVALTGLIAMPARSGAGMLATPPLGFVPSSPVRFSCVVGNVSDKSIDVRVSVLNSDGNEVTLPSPVTLAPGNSRYTTETLELCTKPPCMCRFALKASPKLIRAAACLNDTATLLTGLNCTVAVPAE